MAAFWCLLSSTALCFAQNVGEFDPQLIFEDDKHYTENQLI